MNMHTPTTTITEATTAKQAAIDAIGQWLAVAPDPKGPDGKPIAYNETNRSMLNGIRQEAREKALISAARAGFDTSAIVDDYNAKTLNEASAAYRLQAQFKDFCAASITR